MNYNVVLDPMAQAELFVGDRSLILKVSDSFQGSVLRIVVKHHSTLLKTECVIEEYNIDHRPRAIRIFGELSKQFIRGEF